MPSVMQSVIEAIEMSGAISNLQNVDPVFRIYVDYSLSAAASVLLQFPRTGRAVIIIGPDREVLKPSVTLLSGMQRKI